MCGAKWTERAGEKCDRHRDMERRGNAPRTRSVHAGGVVMINARRSTGKGRAFGVLFVSYLGLVGLLAPDNVAAAPDSLTVRFGDGRLPEVIPVYSFPEGPYVALTDLGAITGHGVVWDPETYRGSVQVDSTSVGFVLDAPMLWLGDDVLQLEQPVVYRDEHVMLPFAIVDAVLVPAMGERIRYDAETGVLELSGGEPRLRELRLEPDTRRLELSLDPMPTSRRLLWDPSGILAVQIGGVFLPPGYEPPDFSGRGLERVEVLPTKRGMEIRLFVAPGWVGARSSRSPRGTLDIELTQTMRDVDAGRFELLTSYMTPEAGSEIARDPLHRNRILIEISPEQPGSYLDLLSSELGRVLDDEFRHEVIFVRDRKAAGQSRGGGGIPEMPGVPPGDCWIGMRLEQYGSSDAHDFLLVTPGQAPRFESVDATLLAAGAPVASPGGAVVAPSAETDDRGVRLIPWGQAPRLFRSPNRQLSRNLEDHLRSDLPLLSVRATSRPSRIFRGLAMPAVLIYPALAGDESNLRALSSRDQVELVAKSLAYGIDEFLREQASR